MIGGFISLVWGWLSKSPAFRLLIGKIALNTVMFLQGFYFVRRRRLVDELLRTADTTGGLRLNEICFALGILLTDQKVRVLALRRYAFWGPVEEYRIKSLFFPPCRVNRDQLADWLNEYIRRADALKSFGLRRQVAPMLKAPGL